MSSSRSKFRTPSRTEHAFWTELNKQSLPRPWPASAGPPRAPRPVQWSVSEDRSSVLMNMFSYPCCGSHARFTTSTVQWSRAGCVRAGPRGPPEDSLSSLTNRRVLRCFLLADRPNQARPNQARPVPTGPSHFHAGAGRLSSSLFICSCKTPVTGYLVMKPLLDNHNRGPAGLPETQSAWGSSRPRALAWQLAPDELNHNYTISAASKGNKTLQAQHRVFLSFLPKI